MNISELNIQDSTKFEKNNILSNFDNVHFAQQISYQDKLSFLEDVLTRALDDNGYYTPLSIELYIALDVIHFYTDINIADGTAISEIYDKIITSGLYKTLCPLINDDLQIIRDSIYATIDNIYKYRNSAYAILETFVNSTDGLEDKVKNLVGQLKSAPEGLDLVKATVDKLS